MSVTHWPGLNSRPGLLRRLARGERLNAAVDWPHVIEEVQDVGLSELRACQSLLQQHLLKLHAWPQNQAAAHCRDEAGMFLDDAARRLTPSMRHRIGLDDIYGRALRRARATSAVSGEPRPMPEACPFTVDGLLSGDVEALLAKLQAAS